MKRLFFALELDAALKSQLSETMGHLHKIRGGHMVKWVTAEKLHITLRFIGETKTEIIPTIISSIQTVLKDQASFTVEIGQLIAFPVHHPRIMAVSIPLSFRLAELYRKIEQTLTGCGLAAEQRPFFPHLTLGRAKGGKIPEHLITEAKSPVFNALPIHEIVLYESEQLPEGSKYLPITYFKLNPSIDDTP